MRAAERHWRVARASASNDKHRNAMKIAPSELSAGPTPQPPSDASHSFESIDKLRAEHTQLLKAYYKSGMTSVLLLEAKKFLDRGRVTGTDLDRVEERLEAQRILDQWDTIIFKSTGEDIDATLADFIGRELDGIACPYVGLRPFTEEDRAVFFG